MSVLRDPPRRIEDSLRIFDPSGRRGGREAAGDPAVDGGASVAGPCFGSGALERIENALFNFDVARPELLEQRALQKRIDRKYLFPVTELPALIEGLQRDYRIVHADGHGLARYSSLYWDTPELDAYHDHRRGRRPRFKVRIRHYVDRSCSYLEIKHKDNRDQTLKARLERGFRDDVLSDSDAEFIAEHSRFPKGSVHPVLWTHFTRIMLVGIQEEERITVDCNIALQHAGRVVHLPNVAIAEIKQAKLRHQSPVIQTCRRLRLRPMSASKYCVAVARLRLSPRANAFAPALKTIRKYEKLT